MCFISFLNIFFKSGSYQRELTLKHACQFLLSLNCGEWHKYGMRTSYQQDKTDYPGLRDMATTRGR